MEVIKEGKDPKDKFWHGQCTNCKTKAKAKKAELNVTYDAREQGEMGSGPCPICKRDMWFYP